MTLLTKVEVHNHIGDILELSLNDQSAEVHIRDITGLGSIKADIHSTPYGSAYGEFYVGSSLGRRNIVMKLGLSPDWAIKTLNQLRRSLYSWFSTRQWVKLVFFHDEDDDLPEVAIEGYVESFEPSIFSKDPELQVSIINPQPDFVAVDVTTVTGEVNDGDPFFVIPYLGTAPTGFTLRIDPTVSNPSFDNEVVISTVDEADNQKTLEVAILVDADQHFKMSSIFGDKYVRHITTVSGEGTSILGVTEVGAWPDLQPGDNGLTVMALGGIDQGQQWTLEYFARFGGL